MTYSNSADENRQYTHCSKLEKALAASHSGQRCPICNGQQYLVFKADNQQTIGACSVCAIVTGDREPGLSLEHDFSTMVEVWHWQQYFLDEFGGLPIHQQQQGGQQ